MRTVVAALLVLVFSLSATAADWTAQFSTVYKSIALLVVVLDSEDGEAPSVGVCTAFSIDQKKSIYLTAGHCYAQMMKLDNRVEATALYIDDATDIMVIQAKTPCRKPALHPARTVYPGEEVAGIGYGMSFNQPMVRAGILSIHMLDDKNFGHRLAEIYDFSFINGMSGGPVIDINGNVVGMVNASYRDGTMGMGRGVQQLRAAWPAWK